jgi:hypothetical protein
MNKGCGFVIFRVYHGIRKNTPALREPARL